MSGESLYLYSTGVIYKWLLRNVLKCQVLVFCGLEEANAQNKLNEGKKKISVFGSQTFFDGIWHWKCFIAGGRAVLFFAAFHAKKGEKVSLL